MCDKLYARKLILILVGTFSVAVLCSLMGCAGLETKVDSPFLDVETRQVYPEIPEPVPPLDPHEIENIIKLHEDDPALMCDQLLAHGVAESSPRKYDELCGVKPEHGQSLANGYASSPGVESGIEANDCPLQSDCEECDECVECPVCDTTRLQDLNRDLRMQLDDAERWRNAVCDSLLVEMVADGKNDRFFGSPELRELGQYWKDHEHMLRECVPQ